MPGQPSKLARKFNNRTRSTSCAACGASHLRCNEIRTARQNRSQWRSASGRQLAGKRDGRVPGGALAWLRSLAPQNSGWRGKLCEASFAPSTFNRYSAAKVGQTYRSIPCRFPLPKIRAPACSVSPAPVVQLRAPPEAWNPSRRNPNQWPHGLCLSLIHI